jgi:hypothetical protein
MNIYCDALKRSRMINAHEHFMTQRHRTQVTSSQTAQLFMCCRLANIMSDFIKKKNLSGSCMGNETETKHYFISSDHRRNCFISFRFNASHV